MLPKFTSAAAAGTGQDACRVDMIPGVTNHDGKPKSKNSERSSLLCTRSTPFCRHADVVLRWRQFNRSNAAQT